MKLSWRSELPMWLLLAGMFAVAAATWPGSPERIPVHWNLHQQVDRYGARFEGLLGIPLLALGLYALLLFVPRIDPGRANYAAFQGTFTVLRLALVAFMAALYGVIHLWMRGVQVQMNTVMPLLMGALFSGRGKFARQAAFQLVRGHPHALDALEQGLVDARAPGGRLGLHRCRLRLHGRRAHSGGVGAVGGDRRVPGGRARRRRLFLFPVAGRSRQGAAGRDLPSMMGRVSHRPYASANRSVRALTVRSPKPYAHALSST